MSDFLFEDPEIQSQKFCLLSFVSPYSKQKHDLHALKVRGVFETKEEACKKAESLRSIDPDFDIFVAQIGRWLPWYPDSKNIPETQYQESQLNEVIQKYKESKQDSNQEFQQRKNDLMNKAIEEGKLKDKIVDEQTVKATIENIEGCIKRNEKQVKEYQEETKELVKRLEEYKKI